MRLKGKIGTLIFIAVAFVVAAVVTGNVAHAGYGPSKSSSVFDPSLLIVDEGTYLGKLVGGDYALVDSTGQELALGDLMGKPLILVLSYYTCDGACSTLNQLLLGKLREVARLTPDIDYNVVTVSFDKNDDLESLAVFRDELELPSPFAEGWKFTLLKNPDDVERLTGTVGFKYFWSKTDKTFLHPSTFILLTPEGRVSRYLYAANIEGFDVEVAMIEAGRGETKTSKITDLKDLFVSACYSYNYKEGRFTVNYPLFIAAASLLFGITITIASLTVFKQKARREEE